MHCLVLWEGGSEICRGLIFLEPIGSMRFVSEVTKRKNKIACERDWGLVPGCGVGGVICWVAIFFIYFLFFGGEGGLVLFWEGQGESSVRK